ncbi:MAG: hypothetical protein IT180_15715 [Acidobacteria bacterium]|nr:hypothetical protein [Acidobacteriota bacterium]
MHAVVGYDPIGDPAYAAHIINNQIKLQLQINYNQAMLLNTNGAADSYFDNVKNSMAPGLLEHVLSVSFGDEDFAAIHAGRFDDELEWPDLAAYKNDRYAQANRLRDTLAIMLERAKWHFPNRFTVMVNPVWNDLLDYGV